MGDNSTSSSSSHHHHGGAANNQASGSGANTSTTSTASCESALTLACENGHTDVVDALIKAGADPDQGDPDKGFTPLMKAARTGQLCTVQYLLLNCPQVDINRTTTGNEHNSLSLACQNGHLSVVELLLQHGANPLHVFKDNSNCLIEAAKGGHTKIVELLIDWNYTLTQQQQILAAAAGEAAAAAAAANNPITCEHHQSDAKPGLNNELTSEVHKFSC